VSAVDKGKGPAAIEARLDELMRERAEREWLAGEGEALLALAPVAQLLDGRYRVGGLDRHGLELRSLGHTAESVTDVNLPGMFDAVSGADPEAAAVSLYEAAAEGLHWQTSAPTWLAVTPRRLAVLRLRDGQAGSRGGVGDVVGEEARRSRDQPLLRRVGRVVKAGASELVTSMRRPSLVDRPQDAVLECPYERPVGHLQSVVPWKPPMAPVLRHGPRWVQAHLIDGSWARLATSVAGATALTGASGDAP
jgi:hypothetical protein